MSPAGTTILRNVLVADIGDHVLSINVVPYPSRREVIDGLKGSVDEGSRPVFVSDTARLGRVNPAEASVSCGAQKG